MEIRDNRIHCFRLTRQVNSDDVLLLGNDDVKVAIPEARDALFGFRFVQLNSNELAFLGTQILINPITLVVFTELGKIALRRKSFEPLCVNSVVNMTSVAARVLSGQDGFERIFAVIRCNCPTPELKIIVHQRWVILVAGMVVPTRCACLPDFDHRTFQRTPGLITHGPGNRRQLAFGHLMAFELAAEIRVAEQLFFDSRFGIKRALGLRGCNR